VHISDMSFDSHITVMTVGLSGVSTVRTVATVEGTNC
jgi:hypothetical protein